MYTLCVVSDRVSAVNGGGLQSIELSSECESASLYLDQHGASVSQLGVTIQNMTAAHILERCGILGLRHLLPLSVLSKSMVLSHALTQLTVHIGYLIKW